MIQRMKLWLNDCYLNMFLLTCLELLFQVFRDVCFGICLFFFVYLNLIQSFPQENEHILEAYLRSKTSNLKTMFYYTLKRRLLNLLYFIFFPIQNSTTARQCSDN